jgi:hypothetical protein
VQERIEASGDPYGYGWGNGWVGGPNIVTYDEGTLLIDFIDPKTRTMIWRGTASAVVNPDSSGEKKEELVREAVAKIMEQFPPAQKQ